jgi:hypothetical protein
MSDESVLTQALEAFSLVEMRLAKQILRLALVAAIAGYAMDCGAMTTPEQATQCCDTMHCSSHGHEHSQECCKTMPSVHVPFVQPASAHGLSFSPVVFAVLPGIDASPSLDSRAGVLAPQCHAPPIPQARAPLPLRI